MDDLLSEKEQIEQMRNWWSVYGGYVILGIAAGALLLYGINYYKSSKLESQLEASSLYQQLTDYVVDGDLDDAEIVAVPNLPTRRTRRRRSSPLRVCTWTRTATRMQSTCCRNCLRAAAAMR